MFGSKLAKNWARPREPVCAQKYCEHERACCAQFCGWTSPDIMMRRPIPQNVSSGNRGVLSEPAVGTVDDPKLLCSLDQRVKIFPIDRLSILAFGDQS